MVYDSNWEDKFRNKVIDISEKIEDDRRKLKYWEATPKDLLFRGDSLFTDKFRDELKMILRYTEENPGQTFKSAHITEKKIIEEKLNRLLESESLWKDLVSKSVYDMSKIQDTFPDGLKKFVDLYNDGFFPTEKEDKNLNLRKKRASVKCECYFTGLYKYLLNNMPDIFDDDKIKPELTKEDLRKLVETISPHLLFKELVKISMKKAYDANINIGNDSTLSSLNSRLLDTNFLQAKRSDLQYSVAAYIRLYLANILLNYLSSNNVQAFRKNHNNNVMVYLKHLQRLFKEELSIARTQYELRNFFELPSNITLQLLSFFERTEVVKKQIRERSRKRRGSSKTVKENIIYVFNHKLDISISFSHNLPRILPPDSALTKESVRDWITPVKDGHHDVRVGDKAVRALNLAQRKEFVVNDRYKELLKRADERDSVEEFATQKEYSKKRNELEAWSNSVWSNTLNITLYTLTRSLLNVKGKTNSEIHNLTADLCGLTRLECYATAKKNEVRSDVLILRSSRQLLLTSLDISDIYAGYPLYYSTKLDFRLRMYPLQYLMSRTSGYLKNLLQEFTPRKVDKIGLRNMLVAYYSPYPDLCKEFCSTFPERGTHQKMKSFFLTNRINLKEQSLYFELLDSELEHLFSTHKDNNWMSSLQLEIDQVGSGPTLVALATGNIALAKKCNLLDGDFVCIYSYLLEQSKVFISKNIDTEYKEDSYSYKLLTEDRKAQKYALMCFFYNQKHLGRTRKWVEQYEEKFGISVSDQEYDLLSEFSVKYPKFMEEVFPNLTKQLDILNEALFVIIDQDLPVEIDTLDGCIISWDFDHTEELKRNYFNPVSGTHDQYKLRVKVNKHTKGSLRTRKSKHKRSFLPNLIHSIDASIMRMFIQEFYDVKKQKINHLHDCVMLHPNDVDAFYNIVKKIYCSEKMSTLVEDLVFKRMKNNTVGVARETLERLENDFIKNKAGFKLNSDTFDPRKCYRYEGAK